MLKTRVNIMSLCGGARLLHLTLPDMPVHVKIQEARLFSDLKPYALLKASSILLKLFTARISLW